jgi:hypothetical protein
MSVEVVHVLACPAAAIAPPGVGVAVEAPVQEVEGLVGEDDVAVLAAPLLAARRSEGVRAKHVQTRTFDLKDVIWALNELHSQMACQESAFSIVP